MQRLIEILEDKGYDNGHLYSLLLKNGYMGIVIHSPLNPSYTEFLITKNKKAVELALVEAHFLLPFSKDSQSIPLKIITNSPCY